jgi:VWFA-related protein
MEHQGFANAHYIGAASAMALHDHETAQTQLRTFLSEDSTNPLAPVARQRLQALDTATSLEEIENAPSIQELPAAARVPQVTFPNSAYLESQLNWAGNEADPDACDACNVPRPVPLSRVKSKSSIPTFATWKRMFTIQQVVDETALFFSVSHRGHSVNDLSIADIQLSDDHKPPEKILQFIPQSKLALRLGLLIDTSESVRRRIAFEKRAAEKFINKVLTGESDLAFIGGFQREVSVTQDFTRDSSKLIQGIEKLKTGGDGTSIFDAVFFACWKLSAYPDEARNAKVRVVLTDGQDNSSHRSLKQAIEVAEAAGVTVYTVSTAERIDDDTDADRILKTIAERTGGGSMFPGHLQALDLYLNQLPQAIRSRYLIAYRPADFKPDGRFRPVRLMAAKNGKRLRVQVRKGYYARMASAGN